MSFLETVASLRSEAEQAIRRAKSVAELEELQTRFFGRKGKLASVLQQLSRVSPLDRKAYGASANEAKRAIANALKSQRAALGEIKDQGSFDPTLPGIQPPRGRHHPLTLTVRTLTDVFQNMGYDVVDGPEVEREDYNFDLLNVPKDHPARDMHDTFYIAGKNGLLLRTHTSPVQLRAMLGGRKPPVRLIVPGRVYRNEATDATHEAALFQCEGLVIDKGIRFTDLLGTLDDAMKTLFGAEVQTRVRPSYFPFVEPGAELFMLWKGTWLEMMGCGMVHPTVLANMRLDPKVYSGFAFGMGVDRLMMLLYGVGDVRASYTGDPRFLESFAP